jgi:hypothetical protein
MPMIVQRAHGESLTVKPYLLDKIYWILREQIWEDYVCLTSIIISNLAIILSRLTPLSSAKGTMQVMIMLVLFLIACQCHENHRCPLLS